MGTEDIFGALHLISRFAEVSPFSPSRQGLTSPDVA